MEPINTQTNIECVAFLILAEVNMKLPFAACQKPLAVEKDFHFVLSKKLKGLLTADLGVFEPPTERQPQSLICGSHKTYSLVAHFPLDITLLHYRCVSLHYRCVSRFLGIQQMYQEVF
jgi:hypothetical protein